MLYGGTKLPNNIFIASAVTKLQITKDIVNKHKVVFRI